MTLCRICVTHYKEKEALSLKLAFLRLNSYIIEQRLRLRDFK